MSALQAAGGDFTTLSDTVAARDGALAPAALLADLRSLRSDVWEPPGGTHEDARVHAVNHGLDITDITDITGATGLDRRVRTETVPRPRGER